MIKRLPLLAIGVWLLVLGLARCQTTQPLPELALDAGTDAGTGLRIDTLALSDGIPQVPYLERLQASGGVRPLRWTLDRAPDAGFGWVQFDDRGDLFGTPTSLASGQIIVSVRDAVGVRVQATFPLAVVACEDGAEYPCELGDAGTCELGVMTCTGGTFSACGALTASTGVFGCGPGCSACDPGKADTCLDGGTCSCGALGSECGAGTSCCPNGGCVDLTRDPAHCRTCENDCFARAPPHMDAGCGPADCVYSCEKDYQSCDGTTADGCESNALTDPYHCGDCSTDCRSYPNIQDAGCSGGICQLFCPDNHKDCNGDLTDGCEANLTSIQTCGSCTNACSTANNDPTCDAGTCVLHCRQGYRDCTGGTADGCETDILNDPSNCGACGNVCPGPTTQSGSAVCVNGSCQIQCPSGFSLCGTGCYDLSNDGANCGTCGRVCAGTCTAGLCCFNGTCS